MGGLAMKNLAQNLISGILIYVNEVVSEGLDIELSDEKAVGTVRKIGWFSTCIDRYDGVRVMIPNGRMIDGCVVDLSNRRFRVLDECFVAIFDNHAAIQNILDGVQALLDSHEVIRQVPDYPPQCVLDAWDRFGARLRVRAHYPEGMTAAEFRDSK